MKEPLEFIFEFEKKHERAFIEFLPISAQGMQLIEKMLWDYREHFISKYNEL